MKYFERIKGIIIVSVTFSFALYIFTYLEYGPVQYDGASILEKSVIQQYEQTASGKEQRNLMKVCSQNQRKGYIESQCTLNNVSRVDNLFYVRRNSQFLAVPKHNVIFCQVSKDACSTWKNVLASSLVGDTLNEYSDIRTQRRSFLEPLGIVFVKDWLPEYESYTRFMVVRHPLDRLSSGYKNMAERNHVIGASFKYNRVINKQIYGKDTEKEIASFADFLRLVSSKDPAIVNRAFYNDRHWLPISQVCQPCSIRYDHFIRLETADNDAGFILNLLKLKNNTLPNHNHRRNDSVSQIGTIGQGVLREYKDIDDEIMANVFDRYRLDFSLYGYTYDHFTNEVKCEMKLSNNVSCC